MKVINSLGNGEKILKEIDFDLIFSGRFASYLPSAQKYRDHFLGIFSEVFLRPMAKPDTDGKITIGIVGRLTNKVVAEVSISASLFQFDDEFTLRCENLAQESVVKKYQIYVFNRVKNELKEFHTSNRFWLHSFYFTEDGRVKGFHIRSHNFSGSVLEVSPDRLSWFREISDEISQVHQNSQFESFFPEISPELQLIELIQSEEGRWNSLYEAVRKFPENILNVEYLQELWDEYMHKIIRLQNNIPLLKI